MKITLNYILEITKKMGLFRNPFYLECNRPRRKFPTQKCQNGRYDNRLISGHAIKAFETSRMSNVSNEELYSKEYEKWKTLKRERKWNSWYYCNQTGSSFFLFATNSKHNTSVQSIFYFGPLRLVRISIGSFFFVVIENSIFLES